MKREISNYDDVIDSREVIDRIKELEGEKEALLDAHGEAETEVYNAEEGPEMVMAKLLLEAADKELTEWIGDYDEDLEHLQALRDEAEDCGDWAYGATLIRDNYFVAYAEELCKDIGAIPSDVPDYIVIDWEATSENLKMDYTTVSYGGAEYLIRT